MIFQPLSLPRNSIRIREIEPQKYQIWDSLRNKWLVATPEEWVRQNFIAYLVNHLRYPPLFIRQEYPVDVNGLSQRADIVVCDSDGLPMLLVECKATAVAITGAVLDQAFRYNSFVGAKFLIITNGVKHYCYHYDSKSGSFAAQKSIPHAEIFSQK